MVLGGLMLNGSENAIIYPLVLGGFSIIASIIGTLFVRARDGGKIMNALYRGLAVAGGVSLVLYLPITYILMSDNGQYSVLALYGSSPRAWGTLAGYRFWSAAIRFIPTGVGNSHRKYQPCHP